MAKWMRDVCQRVLNKIRDEFYLKKMIFLYKCRKNVYDSFIMKKWIDLKIYI